MCHLIPQLFSSEPVPIVIPAWGNMVQVGKVHGNQDDPPKQFGENISFMN